MKNCDSCRFSYTNNPDKTTCHNYKTEYKFKLGCGTRNSYEDFQPILKSGMKVQHKFNSDWIYTLKNELNKDLWYVKESDSGEYINITNFNYYEEGENKMEIDIRECVDNSKIETIRFSDTEIIILNCGNCGYFEIGDEDGEETVAIYDEDIDNLIKALQKVKELKNVG